MARCALKRALCDKEASRNSDLGYGLSWTVIERHRVLPPQPRRACTSGAECAIQIRDIIATKRNALDKSNSGSFSSSMQTFNGPQKKSRKLADTTILARTTRPAKITILAATSRSSVLDLILWLCRNAKQVLHHAEANTFGSAAPLELCIT